MMQSAHPPQCLTPHTHDGYQRSTRTRTSMNHTFLHLRCQTEILEMKAKQDEEAANAPPEAAAEEEEGEDDDEETKAAKVKHALDCRRRCWHDQQDLVLVNQSAILCTCSPPPFHRRLPKPRP